MAKIKKIYEDAARAIQVYPQTHEKAVIDNNGTTLESKMQSVVDLVQQKQMEIGAVPSDITPTRESTNWVTSGGVYDSMKFDLKNVPTSAWITGTVKGSINGSTYAKYDSWDYPKFIPVTGGSMVRVTAGTQKGSVIAFVKNTTMSNGGTVPYATGETGTHTIAVNTSEDFYVPLDANYIHASQKLTESNEFPSSVVEMLDAKSATAVLRNEITSGDTALEDKKQDKYYYTDLTNANIIASRDDINNTNNNMRATLRMQRCSEGDIIECIKPDGYPSASGTMLVRMFDKSATRIGQTGWVSSCTIPQDGYYTAVVNSGVANSGTVEFLLAAITHKTGIEALVKQYVGYRWQEDLNDIIYQRMLLNNSRNIRQFSGKSPLDGQLRYTYMTKLSATQSMAIYNDLVFIFGKGGAFNVYEFGTWKSLGSASAILPTNEVEFNATWFSNEFYDIDDEFPILYTEAIYTSPAVVGCRIQRTNGVWSITKVHSIYRDGETGGAVVIFDQQKDQLVYASTSSFVTYARPKYADAVEGASTLMEDDIITTVERVGEVVLDYGQDKSVYGNIAVGISYSRAPNNVIFGCDLTTGETTFMFSPFTREGEGLEWYNGRLYVCDVQGYLYEIVF